MVGESLPMARRIPGYTQAQTPYAHLADDPLLSPSHRVASFCRTQWTDEADLLRVATHTDEHSYLRLTLCKLFFHEPVDNSLSEFFLHRRDEIFFDAFHEC